VCVDPEVCWQVGVAGVPHDHRMAARAPALQRNAMSMDDVLEYMLELVRLEREEAQRQLLMAVNGLAGIAWLQVRTR
jgi:hypothetical protein